MNKCICVLIHQYSFLGSMSSDFGLKHRWQSSFRDPGWASLPSWVLRMSKACRQSKTNSLCCLWVLHESQQRILMHRERNVTSQYVWNDNNLTNPECLLSSKLPHPLHISLGDHTCQVAFKSNSEMENMSVVYKYACMYRLIFYNQNP